MRRIVFDGYLKSMYPSGIELDFNSPYEALCALGMWPGFREEDEVKHHVMLPQFQSEDALRSPTDAQEILVVPIAQGAGGGTGRTFMMVAIGAFLISTGAGLAAGASVLGGLMTAGTAVSMGAMLVLQGIIALAMDQPEASTSSEKSKYLAANKNTTQAGTRIPLIFGRVRVNGHMLSMNVSSTDIPPSTPTPGSEDAPISGAGVDQVAGTGNASEYSPTDFS
jgi:predicted phage tail protein